MAYNLGQALGSATGQIAGSFIPIPGAGLAGGTLGGYLGGLFDQPAQTQRRQQSMPMQNVPMQPEGNWWSGYGAYQQQLPRYTPNQQNLQNQSIQQILSMLQGGMKPDMSGFAPIEQRARSQFNQQTVPGLAERFTSLGSNRASSPAFASQVGAAGAGLEEGLAALGSQYGLQQQAQQQNLLGMLLQGALQPSYENIYIPGQAGAGAPIAQGTSEAITKMLPLFAEWAKEYFTKNNMGGGQ